MKVIIFTTLLFFCTSVNASKISVLTYNVNYSFINENIVSILESIDADVVCLQETNKEWEQIIRKGLKDKYPFINFKHSGRASGLATLSKYPIIKTVFIKNDPGWFPARILTIKKDQDTIQILNTHLKPKLSEKGLIGWKAYFKADEIHIKELTHFIKNLNKNLPTIILGDFNENDNGKTLKWLKEEMNFDDALSKFNKRSKTWRFILLRGRFDHLCYNTQLNCTNAMVYKLGKSDHFPVMAEFVIKQTVYNKKIPTQ